MTKPTTFYLPGLAWACLLEGIARDAKPGSVIITNTTMMQELCEQTLLQRGRTDITVTLQETPHGT